MWNTTVIIIKSKPWRTFTGFWVWVTCLIIRVKVANRRFWLLFRSVLEYYLFCLCLCFDLDNLVYHLCRVSLLCVGSKYNKYSLKCSRLTVRHIHNNIQQIHSIIKALYRPLITDLRKLYQLTIVVCNLYFLYPIRLICRCKYLQIFVLIYLNYSVSLNSKTSHPVHLTILSFCSH
jgi:hypothetical protein